MSRYGYLACDDCSLILWLGKAVFDANDHPLHFHIGASDEPRNSARAVLNRAIWKFLATHATHRMVVLLDGMPGFDRIGECREIGGDMTGDVSLEDYTRDFDG